MIIWKPGFIYLSPHNKLRLQLYTYIKSRTVKLNILIKVNQIKRRCMYTSDLAYRKLLAKPKTVLREIVKLPNINLQ